MTIQPSSGSDGTALEPRQLLFTPGPRLGWTFRDRRTLCSPYPEPPPDAESMKQQAAARLASAQQHWQRALKWALRPSVFIFIALLALAGCAHAFNPNAPFGTTLITAVIFALPGTGWTLWRLAQLNLAKDADPQRQYHIAYDGWRQRAADWQHVEFARIGGVPEWGSAEPPARRTDVFGGTLTGWQCLLTVHGASILAERPLLVADLSGQDAAADLTALVRYAGTQAAEYVLPRDLGRCGLLSTLSPGQLGAALAEAIHAGSPGTARTERAVDIRVLEQLAGVLTGGGLSLARLAAGVEAALGRPVQPGILTKEETDLIQGKMFGEGYQAQIGTNLVRLDAFLADLARYVGTCPPTAPPPSYYTSLTVEPAPRSARSELIAALVIQWLTVQVTAHAANAPAVIVAGADEITLHHLERLADACDRCGVPLTILFRHLRKDATALIGGATTAFMRLGNHSEAEQAASFIGRHHKFVLSQVTATFGGDQTTTRGRIESWGHSETRGFGTSSDWSRDHMLGGGTTSGGRTRSRDYAKNYSWATELSQSEGTNWSDATSRQRVYEFAVEPSVLQRLPDTALLLVTPDSMGTAVQPVECHPAIITLPQATTAPLGPASPSQPAGVIPPAGAPYPELVPREPQLDLAYRPREDDRPAWPPQDRQPSGGTMTRIPDALQSRYEAIWMLNVEPGSDGARYTRRLSYGYRRFALLAPAGQTEPGDIL